MRAEYIGKGSEYIAKGSEYIGKGSEYIGKGSGYIGKGSEDTSGEGEGVERIGLGPLGAFGRVGEEGCTG